MDDAEICISLSRLTPCCGGAQKAPSPQPTHGLESLFDGEAFLRDNYDIASRPFVAHLIGTQMFDRFIEDRVCSPHLPEVLFFDQSINQKLNRSLTIGKRKYDCSFLDDRSDDVKETFIAPPPSNIGLPDNGTVYSVSAGAAVCSLPLVCLILSLYVPLQQYKAFPRLKKYVTSSSLPYSSWREDSL